MAQAGRNLEKIANECRIINNSMASIGAAVTPCTMPGFGPLFKIDEDEIEVGLGVHGEAGISKSKVLYDYFYYRFLLHNSTFLYLRTANSVAGTFFRQPYPVNGQQNSANP